jgi:predicted nuclease of predicted toxin-antitoxin system
MNIFVDENISKITVEELTNSGFNVIDIRKTEKEGILDEQIWEKAQESNSLLITTDKGFSQYRDTPHHGIIIIRLKKPNRTKIHNRILYAIQKFDKDE